MALKITKEILDAFHIDCEGRQLKGGRGQAYLFDDIVIKPVEISAYYDAVSDIFNQLQPKNYRISRPLKAINGHYSFKGYGATRYEDGHDDDNKVKEKLKVSHNLHGDLYELNITELPKSDDPWSRAHDMLWRRMKYHGHNEMEKFCNDLLDKLPIHHEAYQLIHSDLGGNVMFHDHLLPLVIDFSPAIAPKKFADAVIVCDSIAWGNQPLSKLELLDASYRTMILYAVAFRIITIVNFGTYDMNRLMEEWNAYKAVWDYVY